MKTFKRLFPDLVPDRFEKGNMPPSPAVLGKRLYASRVLRCTVLLH